MASGRSVAGALRFLVKVRSLQLECGRVLLGSLLVPGFTYGSETMIWGEKKRSRIWAVQIESLRGLLGIKRMDKVPNELIRQLCGVTKGIDEKIDEGVLKCSAM